MVLKLYDAPVGSTLGSHIHMGPRQAGNKSLLSYRSDIGVPGYTGFIPQTAALPLQPKNAEYTGRPADSVHRQAALAEGADSHTTSWYRKQFEANPADYHRPDKSGGGYWFTQRPPAPARPFTAGTTYQAELLEGGPSAEGQLSRTVGLRSTLGGYEGARRAHLSRTVELCNVSVACEGARRGLETGTVHGRRQQQGPSGMPLGFTTTYSSMAMPDSPLTRGSIAASTTTSAGSGQTAQEQHQMVQGTVSPRFNAASTYTDDYGVYNSDPLDHEAARAVDLTPCSTTYGMNAGTVRTTRQLPGYCGFIPSSQNNERACLQASGTMPQPRAQKADYLLHSLDQYSRQRVPLYTGHKAHGPAQIKVTPEVPTRLTTQGHANYLATRRPVTAVDTSSFISSNKGTMSFFNAGSSPFASENGLAEAQKFFQKRKGGSR